MCVTDGRCRPNSVPEMPLGDRLAQGAWRSGATCHSGPRPYARSLREILASSERPFRDAASGCSAAARERWSVWLLASGCRTAVRSGVAGRGGPCAHELDESSAAGTPALKAGADRPASRDDVIPARPKRDASKGFARPLVSLLEGVFETGAGKVLDDDYLTDADIVQRTPRVNALVGRSAQKQTATQAIARHLAKPLYRRAAWWSRPALDDRLEHRAHRAEIHQ
jgi:hypothetical protein